MGGMKALEESLNTHLTKGLAGDKKDTEDRVHTYGNNQKRIPATKSLWELIMENFDDAILKILIVAAVVTLIIGIIEKGWLLGSVDGVSILMAIVIIILVTTGNNYSKEKQFQKLVAKAKTDYTPVFRGD